MERISAWMTRAHGGLTYEMTQIIVDHACFEAYLHGIRKSLRFADTVVRRWIMVHTLFHCPSWDAERGNLFVALGLDLDLDREYARVIGGSSIAWTAFARFAKSS